MSKRNNSSSPSTGRESKKSKAVLPNKTTTILDLNDDCLETVFSYMHPLDLYEVKKTCSRFASVADDTFRQQYRLQTFACSSSFNERTIRNSSTLLLSPRMLRAFGKHLYGLLVWRPHHAKYWEFIFGHCAQLKVLVLFGSDLRQFKQLENSVEQPKLDNLQFYECCGSDEDFKRIIGFFKNLKQLTVKETNFLEDSRGTFLQQHFPQLKMINVDAHCAEVQLTEFLRSNSQLERFHSSYKSHYKVLGTLAKYCQNTVSVSIQPRVDCLGVFSVQEHSEEIMSISRLEKLKELKLWCNNEPITSIIESFTKANSLDSLTLKNGKMDEDLCRVLCKITNLKELELKSFSSLSANLLRKLVNELDLKQIRIDGEEYEDICRHMK